MKETLLHDIDAYEGEFGAFGELYGDYLERKYDRESDNENIQSDEDTMDEYNDNNQAD